MRSSELFTHLIGCPGGGWLFRWLVRLQLGWLELQARIFEGLLWVPLLEDWALRQRQRVARKRLAHWSDLRFLVARLEIARGERGIP